MRLAEGLITCRASIAATGSDGGADTLVRAEATRVGAGWDRVFWPRGGAAGRSRALTARAGAAASKGAEATAPEHARQREEPEDSSSGPSADRVSSAATARASQCSSLPVWDAIEENIAQAQKAGDG